AGWCAKWPTAACSTGVAWASPGTTRWPRLTAMAAWCPSAAVPTKSCWASSPSLRAPCPRRRGELMSSHSMNTLLIDQNAGVRRITLNRPEVRNAMSLGMVGDLQQALAEAQADPTVRVLVLQGTGGHFCAGGDL